MGHHTRPGKPLLAGPAPKCAAEIVLAGRAGGAGRGDPISTPGRSGCGADRGHAAHALRRGLGPVAGCAALGLALVRFTRAAAERVAEDVGAVGKLGLAAARAGVGRCAFAGGRLSISSVAVAAGTPVSA